ncbi:hypothetical protein [Sphingomonas solaris]|uniref:Uncharacterized protein n=1 Tax=Alterirhizorhabdus solaris TaxID=2529389 RepID=A0A558QVK9_9SPHN|nr:hypothetical protein [Sphingomonas solaris]TVV71176.1 hypothetical protein FOY91_17405 [Sphingomonas solaris]
MIMIPQDATERTLTIDWFLDAIDRGSLTVFDADDMLAQLRLIGDVANLERVATALASRGPTRRPMPMWQQPHGAAFYGGNAPA